MAQNLSSGSLDALASAAQQLRSAGTADELLQHVVDMAVVAVPACDYAGVSTDRGGLPQSPVVSDSSVLAIDSLQYSIGAGPCLDAMRGPAVIVEAPDLEHDGRYERFGAAAAEQGCRAVLAHRLYVDSQTLGSLNLYASRPHAYSEEDRQRSVVLSAMASLALNMMSLEIDGAGLRIAVESRDVIGQAKGILMERHHITAEEAFGELRRASQHTNVKLRDLSQRLVETRDWPTSRPQSRDGGS